MNLQPPDRDQTANALTLSREISAFSEPSFLLPGENLQEFETIRNMIIEEVQPSNGSGPST